jgi:2,4-dienoyl-CoA reductase-like NADH-dependent reductase (Old Yellow Enzyme family)
MVYKQKVAIPLTLVGGIRSYEVADELVKNGITDYISISRPLIFARTIAFDEEINKSLLQEGRFGYGI